MTTSIGTSETPRPKRYLKPSLLWSIRQGMPTWLGVVMASLALGIPMVIWGILSYGGFVDETFLPTPTRVLQAGLTMFTEDNLKRDVIASCLRVLAGFGVAAGLGIPVGIAMGTFHSMDSFFSVIVGTVRYMPTVAFVPLIVVWVGLGEASKVTIVFLGIIFYNIIMIADAVKFIPDEMLNVAYTLGANRWHVLSRVILPAVLPSILDTLRVNVAGAWSFLVISELIAADRGLGYRIVQAQRFLNTDKVLFCILLIGVIGLITDLIFRILLKVLTPWAEGSGR